ncbi:cation:proton antiporter [Pseudonocardia lacus]|uniref:cation:proton antiporter n=1 Tax=Pseudonocardia lacus TaxID=2835865 RepID=UPI001BDC9BD2|nr:sodium:proton antiporter [Pseudonocardia lacus]
MDLLVVVVLAVVAIVAVTSLAPRVGVAAPLLLVLLGVVVSFLPFVPAVEVEPEWILQIILPPLLYSSAVGMPTMDFRRDFRTISGLSVVLVVASAVAIGVVISALVPGIGLAAGIALGAIVSPTDAVATSIVRKAGVSPRIVTVLEGESMLNDASALVLLSSARTAIGVTAAAVSLWDVAGDFVWAVVVAVAVGWVVGELNLRVRARLRQPTASVALSFVVPFAAFLPTEHLGGSGLVAAVTAGLVGGHGAVRHLRAEDRVFERIVWRTAELLLESSVFLLMGLELFGLVEDLHAEGGSVLEALGLGAVAALMVVVIRTAFVSFSVWRLSRRARRGSAVRERLTGFQDRVDSGDLPSPPPRPGTDPQEWERRTTGRVQQIRTTLSRRIADIDYLTAEAFGWREGVVLVWAGMRGAVTLAAAQSLPPQTPQRSLLVLAAFVVAAGTLLVQGGTLGWLTRRLGLTGGGHGGGPDEHAALRAEMVRVAVERVASPDLVRPDGAPYSAATLELMRRRTWPTSEGEGDGDEGSGDERAAGEAPTPGAPSVDRVAEFRDLRRDLVDAQRRELLRLRDLGTYSSTVLEAALNRLDAVEVSMNIQEDGGGG